MSLTPAGSGLNFNFLGMLIPNNTQTLVATQPTQTAVTPTVPNTGILLPPVGAIGTIDINTDPTTFRNNLQSSNLFNGRVPGLQELLTAIPLDGTQTGTNAVQNLSTLKMTLESQGTQGAIRSQEYFSASSLRAYENTVFPQFLTQVRQAPLGSQQRTNLQQQFLQSAYIYSALQGGLNTVLSQDPSQGRSTTATSIVSNGTQQASLIAGGSISGTSGLGTLIGLLPVGTVNFGNNPFIGSLSTGSILA
jgi:hypothetical protein